ncbi:PQ-loop repeat-containing protein [Candidatus Dependentiae bacterium]|nr:PQ-loop repeat-containing protein [Candidatus Dependentiae bacterium]
MDITALWHNLLVLSQCLYMTCLLPQVVTNYKVKSGTGLSDLFAIGYLNGHFAQLFYVFCLNLPMGYKIFVPVQFLIVLVLIFQRLYYDRFANKALTLFYAINIACAIALIPVACRVPLLCGTANGWLSLIIFSLSQIPQIYKLYTTRSVQGFSMMFVVVMGCGSVLELLGSIFLGLPIQTIFNAVRNTSFVAACLGAFYLYNRSSNVIK